MSLFVPLLSAQSLYYELKTENGDMVINTSGYCERDCISFDKEIKIIVTENPEKYCPPNYQGCALLDKHIAVANRWSASPDSPEWLISLDDNQTQAVIFHEVMHLKYWDNQHVIGHPYEFLAREMRVKQDLGLIPDE